MEGKFLESIMEEDRELVEIAEELSEIHGIPYSEALDYVKKLFNSSTICVTQEGIEPIAEF